MEQDTYEMMPNASVLNECIPWPLPTYSAPLPTKEQVKCLTRPPPGSPYAFKVSGCKLNITRIGRHTGAPSIQYDLCQLLAVLGQLRKRRHVCATNGRRRVILWDGLSLPLPWVDGHADPEQAKQVNATFAAAAAELAQQSARPPSWTDVPDPSSFGSCAVVGGAPTLIGSKLGREIDGHDMVFRFNDHPIGGKYECDVGHRVGVHVMQSLSKAARSQHRSYSRHTIAPYRGGSPGNYTNKEVACLISTGRVSRWSSHAVSPVLRLMMNRLYANGGIASSGTLGVFLAMTLCRTPPTIYGFTTLGTKLSGGLPHYGGHVDMEVSLDIFARNAAWLFLHACLGFVNRSGLTGAGLNGTAGTPSQRSCSPTAASHEASGANPHAHDSHTQHYELGTARKEVSASRAADDVKHATDEAKHATDGATALLSMLSSCKQIRDLSRRRRCVATLNAKPQFAAPPPPASVMGSHAAPLPGTAFNGSFTTHTTDATVWTGAPKVHTAVTPWASPTDTQQSRAPQGMVKAVHMNSGADSFSEQVCQHGLTPVYYANSDACRDLVQLPCAMKYTPWAFGCSNTSHVALLNNDWEHCPGRHEASLLRQIALQHASKSALVQLAVDLMNRLGMALGVSGNPGVGKSTVSALAAYYGMRMLDLEDVIPPLGSSATTRLKLDARRAALNWATEQQASTNEQINSPRRSMIIGLTGQTDLTAFKPIVHEIVHVHLQARQSVAAERWRTRFQVVNDTGQSRSWASHDKKASDMADVIVTSEACPEITLFDVCVGAIYWLAAAANTSQQCTRHQQQHNTPDASCAASPSDPGHRMSRMMRRFSVPPEKVHAVYSDLKQSLRVFHQAR